MKTIQSC